MHHSIYLYYIILDDYRIYADLIGDSNYITHNWKIIDFIYVKDISLDVLYKTIVTIVSVFLNVYNTEKIIMLTKKYPL